MAQAATQNPVPSIPASMMPMQVGGPVRPPPVQHHQQQPGVQLLRRGERGGPGEATESCDLRGRGFQQGH